MNNELDKVIKKISRVDKNKEPKKFEKLKKIHDTLYKQLYNIDVNRTWS